ncbi:MAG: hypothetical protein RLY95_1139 [Pseudomonadota bacterium]|jgi:hypothetical protein
MAYRAGSISGFHDQMFRDGTSEGQQNKPATDAQAPDINEIQVTSLANKFVATEEAGLTEVYVEVEKKIAEHLQQVEVLNADCISKLNNDLLEGVFRSSLADEEHSLVITCAKEMETRAALNGFKIRNLINEPAHYPEDLIFHFALLLAFVALETAVNAFFYQGSAGLIGGAVVALSVSVVNMGVAAFLGYMHRHKNLPEIKEKVIGYVSLGAFIVLALVLNLIFSTFRVQHELLQTQLVQDNIAEPTTAMLVAAFKTAVVDAFEVFLFKFPSIDIMSFVLFFVGTLCSLLAFWKGYTSSDKHPGYAQMDRVHKAALDAYANVKDKAFNLAKLRANSEVNGVENLRNSIIAAHRNCAAIKAQVQLAHASFSGALTTIQRELKVVIDTYRGANSAVRATAPPQYFKTTPALRPDNDGISRFNALCIEIEDLSSKAKTLSENQTPLLGNKLNAIREKLNQLLQEEFQKHLDSIKDKATATLKPFGNAVGNPHGS